MKYSIVIPTYNHCDDLLKPCIESIFKYTDMSDVELIISANGCVDNTKEYLQSLGDKVKTVWFDEPIGFTKATNEGIKQAIGEYIILLNNDIELLDQRKSDWLVRLELPFELNKKTGISGPSLMNHLGLTERTGIESLAIVFYCAMIKRSVIDTIGLLDEAYSPGGVEDHDFSLRAIQAGFELKCVRIPIIHKENQTFKEPSLQNVKILQRNESYYIEKFKNSHKMKYSIVIPTYNHCDDLLKPCIEAICKYTNMQNVELIISANGCVDNTKEYLDNLKTQFESLGFERNIKIAWSDSPTGYAKATNDGIRLATANKIILLNNDAFLLPQPKDMWLDMFMDPFTKDSEIGISAPLIGFSEPAGRNFAIFFAVMIDRKVFDTIGLLNEEYGKGGGEDIEFCIEAENAGFKVVLCDNTEWSNEGMIHVGGFPIYHKGEGTVHDRSLVPDWSDVFHQNMLKLAKKYNPSMYKYLLSNHYERAIFLKGDEVFPREKTRYQWAAENIVGTKILEIGCSTGYGIQFLKDDIEYTGIDYDKIVIGVAEEQNWKAGTKFINANINEYDLEQYDTIIAFEVIEHIENGLELVQKLKEHSKCLLITVPYKEPPGYWGEHHVLHNLDESHLPGFTYKFIDECGNLLSEPSPEIINLMVCKYEA